MHFEDTDHRHAPNFGCLLVFFVLLIVDAYCLYFMYSVGSWFCREFDVCVWLDHMWPAVCGFCPARPARPKPKRIRRAFR
jgi:hypothetical protein